MSQGVIRENLRVRRECADAGGVDPAACGSFSNQLWRPVIDTFLFQYGAEVHTVQKLGRIGMEPSGT